MKRRKFLIGAGSTAIGGSALLGSGAFTRVESQRRAKIQVAKDPDAYLGLDGCPDSPNRSYTNIDESGHLEVAMEPDNETDPGGLGINSDSRSYFDDVFQICNNGKQPVCVWIGDADWPTYNDEKRVEFYVGPSAGASDLTELEDQSIVGEENAVLLGVGECLCIGLAVVSKGLEEDDQVLEDLDNEIVIHADADAECIPDTLPQCPLYGTSREDPTAIFSIRYDPDADEVIEQEIGAIPDDSADSNYPNGLAFDNDSLVWYFAEDTGELKTMNEDGNLGIEEYGVITPGGEPIAGAAFWNATGEYLFIPNGGSQLWAADISGGTAETRVVTDLDWSGINLGDLAIDRDQGILYVSTTNTNESGPNFFSVDLNDLDEQNEIVASNDRTAFAVRSQIAFAESTLWAHNAGNGDWRTVDVSDGTLSDLVDTTREYTDLAQCGFFELEG